MPHPDRRIRREEAGRLRGQERILHRPEVGEQRDVEAAPSGLERSGRCHRRLVDDVAAAAQPGRQLLHRQALQDHEAGRQLERPLRRGVDVDVLVHVRPGEGEHDRCRRVITVEAIDRRCAATGVQGHQHVARAAVVGLLDDDAMAQIPQNVRPAAGGDSVTGVGSGRGRGDEADPHRSRAQVRKPAKTSRRSGVK
jgi:hypothetical protein